MAAMARASFKVVAGTVAVVLALAFAAAQTEHGHNQCNKYTWEERQKVLCLLRSMKHAPVGVATVRCTDKEKNCLRRSMIRMPDQSCQQLGMECTMQDGKPGMVRASLDEWRAAGRLVGQCAPQPRRNDTHVLVRRRWFSPEGQYVQAGHLLCACALLAPSAPLKPFPGHNCVCDGRPKLQPAPFGGFECVRSCRRTCSPQPSAEGSCVFPPLAVYKNAFLYVTGQFVQSNWELQDTNGRILNPPPKNNGNDGDAWDIEGSQLFHRYLPRFFYETP